MRTPSALFPGTPATADGYDPRRGETIRERLSLQGNPDPKEDWARHPKTGEVTDFLTFARTEGRFARQFDAEGQPSPALLASQADRLANWRRLQELAGLRPGAAGRAPSAFGGGLSRRWEIDYDGADVCSDRRTTHGRE